MTITKEKTYYAIQKIPDALFTIVQTLLILRLICVIFSLTEYAWAVPIMQSTDYLTFPLAIVTEKIFEPKSFKFELTLQLAGVAYAVIYTFIIAVLRKIFSIE
jgi:hypothetical protein